MMNRELSCVTRQELSRREALRHVAALVLGSVMAGRLIATGRAAEDSPPTWKAGLAKQVQAGEK